MILPPPFSPLFHLFSSPHFPSFLSPSSAQITLADCLACSGCVTSAESILIQAQSTEEFIQNTVKNKGEKVVVVTVAPQVRASFAMHFSVSFLSNITYISYHFCSWEEIMQNILFHFPLFLSLSFPASFQTTIATAMKKIVFFLKKHCGVDYVFDSSFGREITLLEKKKEFLDKYDQLGGGKGGEKGLGGGKGAEGFPVLCSACPGWVCYAEKRHGDYILPHISKVNIIAMLFLRPSLPSLPSPRSATPLF